VISKVLSSHRVARKRSGPIYYAFVDFATSEEARSAVQKLSKANLNGRKLEIRMATRKPSWKVYERTMIGIVEEAREKVRTREVGC
jgi:RNA recognition motif-containing protein